MQICRRVYEIGLQVLAQGTCIVSFYRQFPTNIKIFRTESVQVYEIMKYHVQHRITDNFQRILKYLGQKACRYADGCTRSDCKFWHKGQQLLKDMDLDVADKLAKIGK